MDQVRYILTDSSPVDVCIFTETFLNSSHNNSELYVHGYQMLRCDRKGKGGGGIMIYVSNLFCVVSKPEISDGFVESLWMEIHMKYNKNIIIGGVYRPPPPENEWLDYFERQMAKIRESGNHIIVAGDFNVNLLSDSNHKRDLEHLMASYNMEQLVCSPTRVTSRSSTLIDHIYMYQILAMCVNTVCPNCHSVITFRCV